MRGWSDSVRDAPELPTQLFMFENNLMMGRFEIEPPTDWRVQGARTIKQLYYVLRQWKELEGLCDLNRE